MNAQKFTQKSLEAIQEAQNLAIENNNMQIEEEHLVAALLQQRDGLIPQLLKKMNVDCDAVQQAVKEKISRIPGVTGPGRVAGKIYVSAKQCGQGCVSTLWSREKCVFDGTLECPWKYPRDQ